MSSLNFPDVNVWVALNHHIHMHHNTAMHWFLSLPEESKLCFCRATQTGFFRLLTNEAVMGVDVLSQQRCWALYDSWLQGGRACFRSEPAIMETIFRSRTMSHKPSPKVWADAYLMAFAESAGLTLVTFDRALAAKTPSAQLL